MKCPKCGSELDTGFNCPNCDYKRYEVAVSKTELTTAEMQEWLLSIGTTRKPMLEEIRELKHRADVAEEALRELIAEMYENGIRLICNQEMLYETRLEQAEARLAELEGKSNENVCACKSK